MNRNDNHKSLATVDDVQVTVRQDELICSLLTGSYGHKVEELLKYLGDLYSADRAYVFEKDNAKGIMSKIQSYYAEGVVPFYDYCNEIPIPCFDSIFDNLKRGVWCIRSLDEEYAKDSPLYRFLSPFAVSSLMMAPLVISGEITGFVMIVNPRANTDMCLLLTVAANLICTDLLARRNLAENDESYLVLAKVREQFETMYFVDFATDYVHAYKTNDKYGGLFTSTQSYSQSMDCYIHNDVALSDRENVAKETKPDNVIARFKKEDSFIIEYEESEQNGSRYCRLRFVKANAEGTQAVIIGKDITGERKFSSELKSRNDRQLQVINAIGSEYDILLLVNIESRKFIPIRTIKEDFHKDAVELVLSYEVIEDAMNAYAEKYIAKNDRDFILEHTKTETILAETPEKGIHTLSYRRIFGESAIYYQINTAKFVADDGTHYIVMGFRNVHALVEEESRKAAVAAEMHDIISAAEMGIWHIELIEGKKPLMIADNRMKELLGVSTQKDISPEELYELWFSRIKPDAVQSVLDSVARMEAGLRDENTYLWIHPTLGERYVRCGGTSIKVANGYILRGYHYDVDELVRDNEKQSALLKDALVAAEHANRAKTTFLNNISHDIRTPMNAIIGYTALASTHLDNKERIKDYLSKITTSSSQLLSLINDVLDMSRIESGKVKIEETKVHLPDILHDLRTISQTSIQAKQLDFYIDTVDVIHEDVICDKLRLNQILLNILSNATKFTKPGGSISVRVIETPCRIVGHAGFEFRIKDTGIGISEEFQKHIFEAFSREHSSTVSGTQGTGLGMAITKNIVDMMGGTIEVKSKEGVGSEFIVRVKFKISDDVVRYEVVPELQGVRSLVADDNSDTAISVCNMLKSIGMRSDWTLSGKEAVLRAKVAKQDNDEYGVYIIDWLMPDMNGIEAVRQIRRHIGDSAPIIILTAYDWGDIEDEAREAGVSAFVSKPIFLSELRDVLSKPFRKNVVKEEPKSQYSIEDYLGKRILLVEDNKLNQEIASEILSQHGFLVDVAEDGSQAVDILSRAHSGQYDLVLMDIQMPKMNGYEATLAIRQLANKEVANLPIIAMTANAFEEDKKQASDAGMNDYIAKPIKIDEFLTVVCNRIKLDTTSSEECVL